MYAGRIVEFGTLQHIFKNPTHPYTRGLLASTPKLGENKTRLETIDGNVPNLTRQLNGCLFKPRCDVSKEKCGLKNPGIIEVEQDHLVSCHFF